jgi:hypothetical protein
MNPSPSDPPLSRIRFRGGGVVVAEPVEEQVVARGGRGAAAVAVGSQVRV